MRQFNLPVLESNDGSTVYDLLMVRLPYPAPMRGFFFIHCEMEFWHDEPNVVEIYLKKDSEIDLRPYASAETAKAIDHVLAKVGIMASSVEPREDLMQEPDCIYFKAVIQ